MAITPKLASARQAYFDVAGGFPPDSWSASDITWKLNDHAAYEKETAAYSRNRKVAGGVVTAGAALWAGNKHIKNKRALVLKRALARPLPKGIAETALNLRNKSAKVEKGASRINTLLAQASHRAETASNATAKSLAQAQVNRLRAIETGTKYSPARGAGHKVVSAPLAGKVAKVALTGAGKVLSGAFIGHVTGSAATALGANKKTVTVASTGGAVAGVLGMFTKVGSRFIPGIGTASLAYDFAKWFTPKTHGWDSDEHAYKMALKRGVSPSSDDMRVAAEKGRERLKDLESKGVPYQDILKLYKKEENMSSSQLREQGWLALRTKVTHPTRNTVKEQAPKVSKPPKSRTKKLDPNRKVSYTTLNNKVITVTAKRAAQYKATRKDK